MDGGPSTSGTNQELMLPDPIVLRFSDLFEITKGFSVKIGGGGSSVVYKGILDGRDVAVKQLKNTLDIDDKTFLSEVNCLINATHNNIVRLLGYCSEIHEIRAPHEGTYVMAGVRQRLLCFEYQPDSLYRRISDASSGLGWKRRYQIIIGICNGLSYLHNEKNIVHRDLKPANILLDDNMVPKITDFGISRCIHEKESRNITRIIAGTDGYLAPEILDGKITKALDIYSLGVIIEEILNGQRYSLPSDTEELRNSALEHVLKSWRNRLTTSQGDTSLVVPRSTEGTLLENLRLRAEKIGDALLEQVRVCADIAIQCMDTDPANRPNIQSILRRLGKTGTTDVLMETPVLVKTLPVWRQVAPLAPQYIHDFSSMNASFCCNQVEDGLDKIGPCGGGGGTDCYDIKVPKSLESLTVKSGLVIDSIQFSYRDCDEKLETTGRWGGPGGYEQVTIKLGPETLQRVSGTYAPFNDGSVVITSLTFVTSSNVKYGPLGAGGGTAFDIHQSKGSIVGFFVRAGLFIDAIGVYVRR